MEQNFRIATDLGYLEYDPSQIVPKDKIKDHPDAKLVIATTGAQGEPMAGLARMANRDHRFVEIQPGDTVIVSASPIPGNEEFGLAHDRQPVQGRRQRLLPHDQARPRLGPRQPGRAQADARADQAQALHPDARRVPDAGPARPPGDRDRGRARRTCSSSRTARRSSSTPTARARRGSPVAAGYVYVDGLSVGDVGDVVLRDRRALANDGMFMIVVTVDKQTGSVDRPARDHHPRLRPPQRARPDHGGGRSSGSIESIDTPGDHISEIGLLKTQIKDGVSRYLYEQTKRRPMVFPVVVEV